MKRDVDWKKIKYLVIGVDGTMTDAGIYYDDHGNELKKFCTCRQRIFVYGSGMLCTGYNIIF